MRLRQEKGRLLQKIRGLEQHKERRKQEVRSSRNKQEHRPGAEPGVGCNSEGKNAPTSPPLPPPPLPLITLL